MALTQMALDSLDFDATVALAETVAPHVDILEIGTPCIKHNGIKLLETLKAKFPNNLILVDLKTMDAGEYEAEPFYKAGADICTVLGASGIATIKGVIAAAKKYGKECQVDMINVDDKESLAKEAVAAGADIIGVHTGLDAQAAGHTPFADLAAIAALNTGAKISVAGGVKAATAQEVKDAGAAIIVAGAAIYGAADPAAAAAWLSSLNVDDPAIARASSSVIREWTRYDLAASADWLNSLPASPELDRAVISYTFRAAEEDPETAMSWASSIEDDGRRTWMMERVASTWKEQDAETFKNYLDKSELSAEQREKLENSQSRGNGYWGRRRN